MTMPEASTPSIGMYVYDFFLLISFWNEVAEQILIEDSDSQRTGTEQSCCQGLQNQGSS